MIRKRYSYLIASVLLLGWAAAAQPAGEDGGRATLYSMENSFIDRALADNPGIKSAGLRAREAKAGADGALALEAPVVSVEFMQSPTSDFPNLFKNQMEVDYAVSQMVPFPGKRAAMATAERKAADMAGADSATRRYELVRRIKGGFAELYLVDRKDEINREQRALLASVLTATQHRYALGMSSQADVLRAQTALAALAGDSLDVRQTRLGVVAMLDALAGKSSEADIAVVPALEPTTVAVTSKQLIDMAVAHRSEFSAMRAEQSMQAARSAAIRKELLPDFMVKATYKQMFQAPDDWGLMVGATVPIAPWSSRRSVSGAEASKIAQERLAADLDTMKNMVGSEVVAALAQFENARQRMALANQSIIPTARQALEATMAGYENGKEEFVTVIDAQRMLVMAKLDYQMSVMKWLDAGAALERAVGVSLDEILREGSGS